MEGTAFKTKSVVGYQVKECYTVARWSGRPPGPFPKGRNIGGKLFESLVRVGPAEKTKSKCKQFRGPVLGYCKTFLQEAWRWSNF